MTTTVFITSGTTFGVPSDCTSADVHAIGAGGGGSGAGVGGNDAAGGGGGAWAVTASLALTASSTVNVQIGVGGGGGAGTSSPSAGSDGTDTWLNKSAASAPGSTSDGVLAKAGLKGNGTTGGAGGSSASCIDTSANSGGTAPNSSNAGFGGSAGAGSGGPNGVGKAGGDVTGFGDYGGGGGGAGDGGSVGSNAVNSSNTGGAGGAAFDTTAGGSGGTTSNVGGNGSASTSGGSGGGGGGGDSLGVGIGGAGGAGGAGKNWTQTSNSATAGSGGGGGGGGGTGAAGNTSGKGGGGGLYGGGGGGGGYSNAIHDHGAGGNGAQGILVVIYTATSTRPTYPKPLSFPQLNRQHPLAKGLVNAFLLNELKGTKVRDSLTNNFATIDGTHTALDVNGILDDGTTSNPINSPLLINPLKDYSLSFKFRPDNLNTDPGSSNQTIFGFSPDVNSVIRAVVSGTNNGTDGGVSLVCQSSLGTDISQGTTSAILSNNNYYNCVMTHSSAGDIVIYVDGAAQTLGSATGVYGFPTTGTQNLCARDSGGVGAFIGQLDYLYLYNRVLTQPEAQSLAYDPYAMFRRPFWPGIDALGWIKIPAASTSGGIVYLPKFATIAKPQTSAALRNGLTGWWPLNGSLKDVYGTNQGNIIGSSTPILPVPSGGVSSNIGAYQSFGPGSGNNWGIYVGNGATLAGATQASIACWVRIDSEDPATDQFIAVECTSTDGSTRLGMAYAATSGGSAVKKFYFRCRDAANDPSGTGSNIVSNTTVTFGRWYHLVGVYDPAASFFAIYVNGVLDNSTATPGSPALGTSPTAGISLTGLMLSPFTNGVSNIVQGSTGDVRFYKRALRSGEIRALYNEAFLSPLDTLFIPSGTSASAGGGLGALLSSMRSKLIRGGLTIS